MWQALIPAAVEIFGGSGGPGGMLSGLLGGASSGKTEVNQSVSQSTSAALLASINNTIGGGSIAPGSQSAPVTQNPNAITTASAAPSPAPVYGQTFGPDYTSGDLSSTANASSNPVLAGFTPAMLAMAAIGVGALWFFTKKG